MGRRAFLKLLGFAAAALAIAPQALQPYATGGIVPMPEGGLTVPYLEGDFLLDLATGLLWRFNGKSWHLGHHLAHQPFPVGSPSRYLGVVNSAYLAEPVPVKTVTIRGGTGHLY